MLLLPSPQRACDSSPWMTVCQDQQQTCPTRQKGGPTQQKHTPACSPSLLPSTQSDNTAPNQDAATKHSSHPQRQYQQGTHTAQVRSALHNEPPQVVRRTKNTTLNACCLSLVSHTAQFKPRRPTPHTHTRIHRSTSGALQHQKQSWMGCHRHSSACLPTLQQQHSTMTYAAWRHTHWCCCFHGCCCCPLMPPAPPQAHPQRFLALLPRLQRCCCHHLHPHGHQKAAAH